MSKKPLVVLLVAIVIGGIFAAKTLLQSKEDGAVPILSGSVDIRQATLAFRQGGRIAELLVDEGDTVKAGDILARLDDDVLRSSLARAEAEAQSQEAQLRRLTTGFRPEEVAQAIENKRAAQAVADNAEIQLRRIQAMRARNAIAQKTLDTAESEARQARAKLAAAKEDADLYTRGYRQEDIDAQIAAAKAARASAELARIALDDAVLKAPSEGTILTRAEEVGAVVSAGQTIMTLTLTKPTWLRVYAPETSLGNIHPGQKAEVFIDCAPGRSFSGTVGFISPSAEFTPKTVETQEVRSSLVYRIRILAEDPEGLMRQGMPVRVRLLQDQQAASSK